MMKRCKRCRKTKNKEDFYLVEGKWRRGNCIECEKDIKRENYWEDPEAARLLKREQRLNKKLGRR